MNRFTKALEKSRPSLTEYSKRKNDRIVSEMKENQERLERMNNRPLNVNKKNRIKKMLKVLNGLPPYNSISNVCYGDGYYSKSIPSHEGVKEFDTAIEELEVEFGESSTWHRFIDKELKY